MFVKKRDSIDKTMIYIVLAIHKIWKIIKEFAQLIID